jgi:ligand-binding sensor domain-containing protein
MGKILPGIILIVGAGVVVYLAPWISGFFTSGSLANFGPNASVFYFSNDGGSSFQQKSDGLMVNEIFDVNFSSDQTMYLSTSQGIFKFDNKKEWQRIKDNTGVLDFPSETRSLVWGKDKNAFLAVNKNGYGKIYHSFDGLNNLTEVYVTSGVDSLIKDLKINSTGRIYFLSSEKIFGYSDDNGKTFRLMAHLDRDFEKIVIDSGNNEIIYLWGKNTIYKSIDGGYNFLNLDVPSAGINDLFVSNNQVIYLATDKGVFQSFDGGWNWMIMDSLLPKDLAAGAVSYNNENKELLAGFDGRLYTSKDGTSWSVKTIGVNHINIIKINPFNSNEILVGMKKQ